MITRQVAEIVATLPQRISDVIHPWAEISPDRPAVVEASGTWTYAELASAVKETQTWLAGLGVRPGDRVLIVCENCRALVAMFLALAGLDAWPVLVNARLSARELDEIRDHCGARLIFFTTSVSLHARDHAKRYAAVTVDAPQLGPIAMGKLNDQTVPESLDSDIANNVAALIYTSGTTGLPKGVMLTHRNLLFVAATAAKIRSLTVDDRLYGILPVSHSVGLSVVMLGTLLSGATLYLTPRFDPALALAALEKQQLTIVLGVPAMFALLVEYAKFKNLESINYPSLRILSCSGAPLSADTKAAVERLFGKTLHHGYGVSECSPNIAQTRVESPRSDMSVGLPFPGVEIKLVGLDGQPVADGGPGELWVRGPNVMKGYYRAPEETAAAIDPEGWFNTRDLVRIEDGNLFIVGRTKELIVRFGFNVYPAEVEGVLNSHPAVVRSAVIGRSANGDEEIHAFIQLLPESAVTVAELAAHAAQHLAPYKQPTQIWLVASMPLTPTGKIVKDKLAKMVADSASSN